MPSRKRRIAVFGSTGSIGTNTLAVARALPDELQVAALAACRSTSAALAQAIEFRPRWLIIHDAAAAAAQDWSTLPRETELLVGDEALTRIAAHPDIDCVVAAIVGSAGLASTWAAVEAGKRVALANKETLVMAGALVMELAAQSGAEIVPVDSEHSAIFQSLQAGPRTAVERIVLTASGGPFRTLPLAELRQVTAEQALRHPVWSMGKKVTIDSATMMNKALEIIEARWLFNLRADQIGVMVHPQSIIHSLVEFQDGALVAQLGPPDMKLPIQYALTWPAREIGPTRRFDWTRVYNLEMSPPDLERFPALELGWRAAREGGTTGAVLNAANEAAVNEFLAGELPFCEITAVARRIVDEHPFEARPTLTRLIELDRWAREQVTQRVAM